MGPNLQLKVLDTRRISLGDHAVIFHRVEPPVAAAKPLAPPSLAAAPTAQEIQALETLSARTAQKPREALFVTATVFNNSVTELRWTYEGRSCRAFSNINFNYFAGITDFESSDKAYFLMAAIMNQQLPAGDETSHRTGQIPKLSEFSPTRSELLIEEDENDAFPDEAFAAVEALHVYFDADRQTLIDESSQREAARIAREQWLRDHPPVPQDTVINYWPVKSRLHGASTDQGDRK